MKTKLYGLAVVVGLLGMLPASGCVVRARVRPAYVVDVAPPEPQYEQVAVRPGYVWVRGHWNRVGARWVWQRGHYERARTGYRWEPGHWEHRANRYHWIEGRWVAGASVTVTPPGPDVTVRDHRAPPAPPPAPDVTVRDHRNPPPAPDVVVRDHRTPPPVAEPAPPSEIWVEVEPPAPKAENQAPRAGYIWVAGRWEYRNGNWKWKRGRWEAQRAGYRWERGHWQHVGRRWYWIEGHWSR